MSQSITVSERAARRIAEIVAGEPATPLLRVSVEGGGCSGFQYKFDLVPASEPDDLMIERAGAKVLVDPVSLTYLTGSQIDFVDELIGSQFKVLNPNAATSCGCGTSFSLWAHAKARMAVPRPARRRLHRVCACIARTCAGLRGLPPTPPEGTHQPVRQTP